jgi:hypothetical protein
VPKQSLRSAMTSYLRNWLLGAPTEAPPAQNTPQESPEIEIVPPEDKDGGDSDDGYDTDRPPAFPALNSPQRASSSANTRSTGNNGGLMAPPPPRISGASSASSGNSLAPLTTTKVVKKSRKVALAPGHSTLDWANLKTSGVDLRVCPNLFLLSYGH